jgi:hypothetical protein
VSDFDINKKRLELINLTFDELVEFCLDLLIQRDIELEMHKKEVEQTYDAGASHGYAEGRNDEINERRF